jgi:hypothetical protein
VNLDDPRGSIDETGKTPAADFFSAPLLTHIAISPDGTKLAAISSRGGVDILIWRAVTGGETHALAKLERRGKNEKASQSIKRLGWPNNEQVIVSIEMPYSKSIGVRARQTRLMVVDLDGSIKYLGEDWPYQEYSQYQDHVIDWLPGDARHIMIGYAHPDDRGLSIDAMLVNVRTGSLSSAAHGANVGG